MRIDTIAGTVSGGKQAADTNKERYGDDYYRLIGSVGGKVKTKKGFASMTREKRIEAGRKGGRKSRRTK